MAIRKSDLYSSLRVSRDQLHAEATTEANGNGQQRRIAVKMIDACDNELSAVWEPSA